MPDLPRYKLEIDLPSFHSGSTRPPCADQRDNLTNERLTGPGAAPGQADSLDDADSLSSFSS